MLVSVIVPLYNKAAYIQRTLTSILAQTHAPLEVIVVNDGSTDDSVAQVEALQDERIRLIHQDNAGPGMARNHGLALARAPYVAFLDADDEWSPNFLARSVDGLQRHRDCALSVSGHRRGPEQQNWAPILANFGIESGRWRLPLDLDARLHKPTLDMMLMGTMVCDRTILQQLGGFYTQNRCTYGEDSYLWLQVLLNYPIYRHLDPLMWYHTEASSLAIWNRSLCPAWPMVLDPEPIRQTCPSDYLPVLEDFLVTYAGIAAQRAATYGDWETLHRMLSQFPQIRQSGSTVFRLYLAASVSTVPHLRPVLRWLKQRTVNI